MINYEQVSKGISILTECIVPFVCKNLIDYYGRENWWKEGVYNSLADHNKKGLPISDKESNLIFHIDLLRALRLVEIHWKRIFTHKLSSQSRKWVHDLIKIRNKWAHKSLKDLTNEETLKALDTISEIIKQLNRERYLEIKNILRDFTDKASFESYEIYVSPKQIEEVIIGQIKQFSENFQVAFNEEKASIIIKEKYFIPHPLVSLPKLFFRAVTNKVMHLNIELIPFSFESKKILFEVNNLNLEFKKDKFNIFAKNNQFLEVTENCVAINFEEFTKCPLGNIKRMVITKKHLKILIGI